LNPSFNYSIEQRSPGSGTFVLKTDCCLHYKNLPLILEGCHYFENTFPSEINHIFASLDIDNNQNDFDYAEYLLKSI
jgi:N-acylneuraminate cytidylyltransferase